MIPKEFFNQSLVTTIPDDARFTFGFPDIAQGNNILWSEFQTIIEGLVTPGASAFTDLTDTFAAYTNLAGFILRVNATEDGIEALDPADISDLTAFHSDIPNEFLSLTEKTTIHDEDVFVLEDYESTPLPGEKAFITGGNLKNELKSKLTVTGIKTGAYNANANELIPCNISSASFSVTLPTTPPEGTVVKTKLTAIGLDKVLTVLAGGSDVFNRVGGTSSITYTLIGEWACFTYDADLNIWFVESGAPTYNFAANFPGIDVTTPISDADISFNVNTGVLTISPPLGYLNVFSDGNGVINRFVKSGTINFPAITNTSGTWFFYFDSTGTAVSTQTPWTTADFPSIAPVYRILWNATLYDFTITSGNVVEGDTYTNNGQTFTIRQTYNGVTTIKTSGTGDPQSSGTLTRATGTGDATLTFSAFSIAPRLVSQYIEYHPNDITAKAHQWMHLSGSIWRNGFDMANNALTSGAPNADGRNSVIALSTGSNIDDNLEYTVTNDSTPLANWQQDLGNTTPASLNATNSALFKVFRQNASGLITFRDATRFPFDYNTVTNIPNYITALGVRTPVTSSRFFVYFVYATQNPTPGEALKLVSATQDFTSITDARAYTYSNIQNTYAIFGLDFEIRPLYRLIFEYRNSYSTGCMQSVLRETQDIRKAAVTSTTVASGSIPASSVTSIATTNITSTNGQSDKEQIDTKLLGYTATTSAASTTTLDVNSTKIQRLTGTTTHIYQMPVVSTLNLGRLFEFQNDSTGILTINSSGGNAITTLAAGETKIIECISLSGTDATSWKVVSFGGAGDMILSAIQSVTGLKTFDTEKAAIKGSSTGKTVLASANVSANDYTATFPAKNITIAGLDDATLLSNFDATIGIGGQYASVTDAITAGKYRLKAVGDVTESADIVLGATSKLYVDLDIYNWNMQTYNISWSNVAGSIEVIGIKGFAKITFAYGSAKTLFSQTTTYANAPLKVLNILIDNNSTTGNCYISDYGNFKKCRLELPNQSSCGFAPGNNSNMVVEDSDIVGGGSSCYNAIFQNIENRAEFRNITLSGTFQNTDAIYCNAGNTIIDGLYYTSSSACSMRVRKLMNMYDSGNKVTVSVCVSAFNSTAAAFRIVEDGASLVKCTHLSNCSLLVAGTRANAFVINNVFSGTLTYSASTGTGTKIIGCRIASTTALTGTYFDFSNNICTGAVTLNSGSINNNITDNTFTGGFTDSSGSATNKIIDNTILNRTNASLQQTLSLYTYQSSTVGDAVGDTRFSNQSGWHVVDTCTVSNAAKGSGTWVRTQASLAISLTDSNELEGAGSYVDLISSKSGIGRIVIGDCVAVGTFCFQVDGTVTLIDDVFDNIFTSLQTGTNHVIIKDNGSNVRIVNELGATLLITILINYNS